MARLMRSQAWTQGGSLREDESSQQQASAIVVMCGVTGAETQKGAP
jgi:hypothetical protein